MDYISLIKKIDLYKQKYVVKLIGETYFKRKIMAVEIIKNNNNPTAILNASIHAREFITSDLVCKMIDDCLFDSIENFNVSIIIMANPDGVELVKNGIKSAPENERNNLLKINHFSNNFLMWKANGRGVDLNNNFDAYFGTNKNNYTFSPHGFCGYFAESEVESKAIANYTRLKQPFFTVSYHSKGEEIYYNFFQDKIRLERDKIIAEKFSSSTGYIIKNPEKTSSGGYKDYCVQALKIPSITIEVGNDNLTHPISEIYLDEIYEKNKNIAKDLSFAFDVFKDYGRMFN